MRRSLFLLKNFLSILFFVLLGIALFFILQTTRVTDQGEIQVQRLTETIPGLSPDPQPDPTKSPKPTPVAQAYPYPSPEPSPVAYAYPYPLPEKTLLALPTAIPPTPVVLPPLATYPPIGSFSDMRVLYTKDNPQGYYSNKVDGSDERRFNPFSLFIEEQVGIPYSIKVSPDGSKILYSFWDNLSFENANAMSIWLSDPEGKEIQLLVTKHDEWFPEDGIWSPDGKRIAYRRAFLTSSYRDGAMTGARELWIMNADGTEHRKVLDGLAISNIDIGDSAFVFLWSRNGYIYFATRDDKLYAVNPEDGALYLLLSQVDALLDLYKNFSPDGQHLVSSTKLTEQFIADFGFLPVRVSGEVSGWSTDGSKLIYTNNDGIWMRDINTGKDKHLVSNKDPGNPAVNPSLSPDNKFLAYQTGDGLFVYEIISNKLWLVISDPKTISGYRSVDFRFWILSK